MAESKPKVYWEASPFTAMFNDEANRSPICHAVLLSAQKGDIELHTSTLTLVEVFRVPTTPQEQDAERRIVKFFANRWIRKHNLDWFVAEEARRLQRQFPHLDGRDATHLARAVYLGVDILHTYDEDDLIRCNGQIPGLIIKQPEPFGTLPLDLRTS